MSSKSEPKLVISSGPFLHAPESTPRIMGEVLASLLPVIGVAIWYFGMGTLLVVLSSCFGAALTEWLWTRQQNRTCLKDLSALLTGALLGLTLSPAFPLWMAFLGGVSAIGLGKLIWGGLGQNIFNPALVGRAFLQASFPSATTTWSAIQPGNIFHLHPSLFALPLAQAGVDAQSSATPLGLAKFSQQFTDHIDLLTGNTTGSIGETSAVILILCGLWLGFRKLLDWRLPVSTLLSAAIFSGVLILLYPQRYPDPIFMLLSGGLLFGAVYMVTDPVTTPTTPRGMWIFGIGVGFLVVLIRVFGGLAEGVMYAILLMNAVVPYINHYTQPRHFGARPPKRGEDHGAE